MDDANQPPAAPDDERAQIEARRRERRARRKMRQAIADAALTAAADSARAEGFTIKDANGPDDKDPSFDRAEEQPTPSRKSTPAAAPTGAHRDTAEDNDGGGQREAPKMTELARIKPTSIQAPSAQGDLSTAIQQDDGYAAAQAAREARMSVIRQELRRRRRLRTFWLLFRFALFVLAPTVVVGWLYYEKATDMYVSVSSLVFKGGAATGGDAGGGLFGGGATPISNPAIDLQEFILSRDMLRRLDQDHDYIKHFQSEEIDEFHRLAADATFDDAYSYYKGSLLLSGKIAVSYDITEGIVRMEVVGPTAEAAKRFSDAIITYGEERVNDLNDRSRNDGVRLAEANVEKAKAGLIEAQNNVNQVQEKMKIFSTESEAGALQARILTLETSLADVQSQIRKLQTVAKDPNDSRYAPLRLEEAELRSQLDDLRQRLTGGGKTDGPSLSELNSRMNLANIELAAANLRYNSAITSLDQAIQSASAQSLYLETVVAPNLPADPSRPDRVTNTALVFLILFATYILGLLTISVIREQAAI
ncbi:MAG: hypothetical protein ACPGVA_06750 [Pikeienuella sp.]